MLLILLVVSWISVSCRICILFVLLYNYIYFIAHLHTTMQLKLYQCVRLPHFGSSPQVWAKKVLLAFQSWQIFFSFSFVFFFFQLLCGDDCMSSTVWFTLHVCFDVRASVQCVLYLYRRGGRRLLSTRCSKKKRCFYIEFCFKHLNNLGLSYNLQAQFSDQASMDWRRYQTTYCNNNQCLR